MKIHLDLRVAHFATPGLEEESLARSHGDCKSELSREHPWKTKTSKLGKGLGEVKCDAKIQDLRLISKLRHKARVTDAKSRGGGEGKSRNVSSTIE